MCDIYGHRCEYPGCDQLIDWHIGDFLYDRKEFRIWCPRHWKEAPAEAVVFRFIKVTAEEERIWAGSPDWEEELSWGAVAAVGPVGFDYDNHPNTIREWEMLTMTEAKKK